MNILTALGMNLLVRFVRSASKTSAVVVDSVVNSITFEFVKECYSFVTVLLTPGDERYFKIAQAYKIEKNVIIKFHVLKFYNELVNELLEKTHIYPNPFLYVHKNIMNAA
jgi:hypothetical protein